MQFIMGITNNMPTLIGKASTQCITKLQLSLTIKASGCEYDDHATSGPLLCCVADTIVIRT